MKRRFLFAWFMAFLAGAAVAAEPGDDALDREVETLKQDLLRLDRELQGLEENLVTPVSTRTRVFVSMDVGQFFRLDAVEVKFDGASVAHHLYSAGERQALVRGAAQELYVGNLAPGSHAMTLIVTGVGPKDRDYRIGKQYRFNKDNAPKYLQLNIFDSERTQQPELTVKEW